MASRPVPIVAMAASLRQRGPRGKYARTIDEPFIDRSREVRLRTARVANGRKPAIEVEPGNVIRNSPDCGRMRIPVTRRRIQRQVRMQINETGRQDAITAIEHDCAIRRRDAGG